jgi:Phage major capsid protein E
MASINIFRQDPFSTIQLTTAVERTPYLPQGLKSMGIFTPKPIRTKMAMVEQRQGVLRLVPFTDRGAPGTQRTTEQRSARGFLVPRIRMEDTIYADEIADIRAFGEETELMQVQTEVARRLVGETGIRNNIEYTREYHRLAAIQGLLLDADGSTRFNWFNEFEITPQPEITFNFAGLAAAYISSGAVTFRPLCNQIVRNMKRAAQGSWVEGRTRPVALCGDAFFDALISNPEVRSTYLNWVQAAELRQNLAFEVFNWGGIDWVNYRGSDDTLGLLGSATASSGTIACVGAVSGLVGDQVSGPGIPAGATVGSVSAGTSFTLANSVVANATVNGVYNFGSGSTFTGGGTIGIPSNKAKFFPRFAPGIFEEIMAPGESFEWINTLGKPEYVRMIMDRDRNEWVKAEMTAYPLHICARPETLVTGTMDNAAD